MNLQNKIETDLKQALKNKEKERLEALRSIKTALSVAKTAKGASKEIPEEEEIKILQKLLKQRKESAEIYEQQNRQELAEKERKEAETIQEYLPKPISDEELTEIVKEIINETGAKSMSDMGKVMGIASRQLAGKAEGKAIAGKVKELLENK
ncbi:MAG: GatB/YqeY domain-containing protein [Bacteroidota bacterium]